eukprot:2727184-Pyramimonas_sp.AAC.1
MLSYFESKRKNARPGDVVKAQPFYTCSAARIQTGSCSARSCRLRRPARSLQQSSRYTDGAPSKFKKRNLVGIFVWLYDQRIAG